MGGQLDDLAVLARPAVIVDRRLPDVLVDGGIARASAGVWFIVTENAIPASAQKSVNACVAPALSQRTRTGWPARAPAGSCASASLSTAMWSEAVCAGALPGRSRAASGSRVPSRNASSG